MTRRQRSFDLSLGKTRAVSVSAASERRGEGWLNAADHWMLLRLRTLPHTAATDRFAIGLSGVANHCICWYAVSAVGIASGRRTPGGWVRAAVTVGGTEQVSRAIKRRVHRHRPQLADLPPLARVTSSGSFPSSHAATAATAISAYRGLLPQPALVTWATLTALSRPYLGVHYPSDVIVGLLLGALIGQAASRWVPGT
jgi:membrane-associated phospholipid phosphatase